jgi:hypothetical protein
MILVLYACPSSLRGKRPLLRSHPDSAQNEVDGPSRVCRVRPVGSSKGGSTCQGNTFSCCASRCSLKPPWFSAGARRAERFRFAQITPLLPLTLACPSCSLPVTNRRTLCRPCSADAIAKTSWSDFCQSNRRLRAGKSTHNIGVSKTRIANMPLVRPTTFKKAPSSTGP